MKKLLISTAIAILVLCVSAWGGEWTNDEGRWNWVETPIEWNDSWDKAEAWLKVNYPGWQIYRTFRDYKLTEDGIKYYYSMRLHIPKEQKAERDWHWETIEKYTKYGRLIYKHQWPVYARESKAEKCGCKDLEKRVRAIEKWKESWWKSAVTPFQNWQETFR